MKLGLETESCHLLFQHGKMDVFSFIEKTVENWKGLWEYCYNNYVFEKQYKYLKLIIENCTVDSILGNQNNEKLRYTHRL